jgi:hypothetical protein
MKHRLLMITASLVFALPISVNAQAPGYARVLSENANLRDIPSVTSASREEIAEGTVVKVLDKKLPWYVVRFGNLVGWMHGNTLEFINRKDSVSNLVTKTF